MSQNKSNTTNNVADDFNPTIFHDFLGSDSSPPLIKPAAGDVRQPSPSASPSLGGGSSAGGRGPISTTSDLGSVMVERPVGQHFEGVPFYNPRSEFLSQEIGNRFAGSKRSNSDSAFIGSSRDNRYPQIRPESMENSHLMKMIRSAGGDRPRRAHEDETVFMHHMRPTSASLILNPASGRADTKWDRAVPINNVAPVVQYPPRAAIVPFGYHQPPSNRFRDVNMASPSVVSQGAAADEGSRTGIKGSGILSSINAGSGIAADRNPPSVAKLKTGARVSELESSTNPRSGLTSSSRQMTIFYGGQAHVFDDVHPNKADVIMDLAGSKGGSWSTTFMPKSTGIRQSTTTGENSYAQKNCENETNLPGNSALPREYRARSSVAANSSHQFGTDSIPPPVHQGSIVLKEARGISKLPEAINEEKQ